ncbi:MAG: 2TM domain-containing protein [Deltaproteobacteria bacterium]|nr:2TM domain-containing protein [Deltaproteobacteria bacterium]
MNDERYEKAKARVKELKGFYSNLITYVVINLFLIIINLLTSPTKIWFFWVTIFWGIGVLIHASKVFVLRGRFLGEEWEKRKIQELMEKDGRS